MKIQQQIDEIIAKNLPFILKGETTLESVLEKHSSVADQLKPRLEAALWLSRARQSTEPRPGNILASRRYLEDKIQGLQPISSWQRLLHRFTPQRWAFNILAPILVAALLTLIVNSTLLTARLSIPGDPLYGTKLFIEDVQLAFTFNPVKRTELYIQYSHQRTIEFVELLLEGDYDSLSPAADHLEAEIIASLHSLNRISPQQALIEQSAVMQFKDSLTNEVALLNMLKTTSPPSAHPGIELAIQVAQSGIMALR